MNLFKMETGNSSSNPPPQPLRWPRALANPISPAPTLSTSMRTQTSQLTNSQESSPLFAKLPFELRQQIYKHVLLGWGRSPIVHIHHRNSRLSHWRCQIEEEDHPCNGEHSSKSTACVMLWNEFEAYDGKALERLGWYFREGMNDNLLPMLQSCRKIYAELITLLYERTTFHFPNPTTVSQFTSSLPSQHLINIRSISIDWDISSMCLSASSKTWAEILDLISKMPGIRDARLIVAGNQQPNWHYEFQWKWEHEGLAKKIEDSELRVDFWNSGTRIPAVFGEDERRLLPSTYAPPRQWGKEWYEC